MAFEPSQKRRGRDRRRVDGRARLEHGRGKPGERKRFVREAEEAIVLCGCPGSIESTPTVAGRDACGSTFGFRMQAEGARDREKPCGQQDDLR